MNQSGYISMISKFKIDKDLGPVALEILQLFAYNDSLSAYDIFSNLKSTRQKTAYKNVHKKVQRLKSMQLIEQTQVHNAEHGAKYYGLSEYGIYQLFLKRRGALTFRLVDENKAIFVGKDFIKHHSNNALFEAFLYHYFDRKTVSTANYDLIIQFFLYLHDCCKEIETLLNYIKKGMGSIPAIVEKFKWNYVGPGPEDQAVKSSLKEIFDFEGLDLDNAEIKKINSITLQVTTPDKACILIKLDPKRKKAVATLHKFKRKKEYEYDLYERGFELRICTRTTAEELGNKGIKIELPIYRILSDLTKSDDELEEDTLRNLAKDDKFMKLVDNIHDTFDKGYNKLLKLRMS